MSIIKRKYGYLPDAPDHRDYRFVRPAATAPILPAAVDLRDQIKLPVLDQGDLGSCTANAISNCYRFLEVKENQIPFQPSRLFIYYNERKIEGTIKEDSGAQIRDGFKSIGTLGVCDEAALAYDVAKFKRKPSAALYKAALAHKALEYRRLDNTNLSELKSCLADGFPFVFGFSVYSQFESADAAKTGIVNLPAKSEKMLGGHAVLCVGYSDADERFLVQNSWGENWGQSGFFTIPYAYLTDSNLADDFWTARKCA